MKTERTSEELKSRFRLMEARSCSKESIDRAYELYWEAVDRERAEHQEACRKIDAENKRIADANRAER